MAHILVIEDNTTLREGIVQILEAMDHDVYGASNGTEGLEFFQIAQPELVITDLKMEEVDGMQVLHEIKTQWPNTLVIIITAFGTIELAVEAMQLGAFDFITKPFSPDMLRVKVGRSLEVIQTHSENAYLRQLQMKKTSDLLICKSGSTKKLQQLIKKIAPLDLPVLINGEPGTGKDLLSRAIHQSSPREHKPFIKIDCAKLSAQILESEIFGHERGTFGQETKRKQGKFELAHGGTVFLDSIHTMPLPMQQKLVEVIQTQSFRRIGGTKDILFALRLIAASHLQIEDEIKKNNFNPKLHQLLQASSITLPSLKQRQEDIPDLIAFFLDRLSNKQNKTIHITGNATEILQGYAWPGNIRQLQTTLEGISNAIAGDTIDTKDIPQDIQNSAIIEQS